jgi:ATP synthase F1 delta subunit
MSIARKYAHAFLNVFRDQLTSEKIEQIAQMGDFLSKQQRALFLLQVPIIPDEVKKTGLFSVMERYKIAAPFTVLIDLLIASRRAHLVADICRMIDTIYKKEHRIHIFIVASSSPLASDQRVVIEQFLAARVKGTIIYRYKVVPKLIAGVRLQSDTLLWEYSVDQQLRDLQRAQYT